MEKLLNILQIDIKLNNKSIKEFENKAVEEINNGNYAIAISYLLQATKYKGENTQIDEIRENNEKGDYDD